MRITTTKELMAELKRFQFLTEKSNEEIAQKRGVSRQTVSSFFNRQNPRFENILETIDAMDGELHITIVKKKKGEEE